MTADSVLVVAPNWLGDAVMALPAIADLRRHYAAARLVVAARPSVASLFELVPGVDAVVTLRWRGRLWASRAVAADAASLGAAVSTASPGFSLPTTSIAVLLPNSFASAWLARRAGIAERWGYATDWRGPLLTRRVATPRRSVHQGTYYQHLVAELGVPSGPLEPAVVVSDAARREAQAQLTTGGWDGRQGLVTMAPGAAYGTAKRWLPDRFAEVIARLQRERGVRTVLVGSAADGETIRTITAHAGAQAAQPIDLAGQTSLRGLAGVLALSAACVANDSGAMHLAGAVGTPIVALFGPTRDSETAPLTGAAGYREILVNQVWCRPCMLRECPIDHRCMTGLPASRVLTALAAILDRGASPPASSGAGLAGGGARG